MNNDIDFMRIALQEAEIAFQEGEIPVGAVLVIDGEIVAKGHNQKEAKKDVTSHAEIEVIKQAATKLGNYRLDNATLYVTLEPCMMCCGAILDSKIKRLVFGVEDPQKGAIVSNNFVFDDNKKFALPLINKGIMKEECQELLMKVFLKKRSIK